MRRPERRSQEVARVGPGRDGRDLPLLHAPRPPPRRTSPGGGGRRVGLSPAFVEEAGPTDDERAAEAEEAVGRGVDDGAGQGRRGYCDR